MIEVVALVVRRDVAGDAPVRQSSPLPLEAMVLVLLRSLAAAGEVELTRRSLLAEGVEECDSSMPMLIPASVLSRRSQSTEAFPGRLCTQ